MVNNHLKIAEVLLENRELAHHLAQAIHFSLQSLDLQLVSIIKSYAYEASTYSKEDADEIMSIIDYWSDKLEEDISLLMGVNDFNVRGCEGEQTYKFIQGFTQNRIKVEENYTQSEFNELTEDSSEENPEKTYTNSQAQADAETNYKPLKFKQNDTRRAY